MPVTQALSSEARNTAALPRSSGIPIRPMGPEPRLRFLLSPTSGRTGPASRHGRAQHFDADCAPLEIGDQAARERPHRGLAGIVDRDGWEAFDRGNRAGKAVDAISSGRPSRPNGTAAANWARAWLAPSFAARAIGAAKHIGGMGHPNNIDAAPSSSAATFGRPVRLARQLLGGRPGRRHSVGDARSPPPITTSLRVLAGI